MSLSLFVKGDIINSIYLTGLLQYKEKISQYMKLLELQLAQNCSIVSSPIGSMIFNWVRQGPHQA